MREYLRHTQASEDYKKKGLLTRGFALGSSLSSFLSVVAKQAHAVVDDRFSGFVVAKYSTQSDSDAERNRAERDALLRVTIHCFYFPPVNLVT